VVLVAFITESSYRSNVDSIIISSFSAYFLLMIYPMFKGHQILSHLGKQAQRPYRWLCVLAAMMAINIALEIAIYIETSSGKRLHESIALFVGTNLFILMNTIVAFAVLRRNPLIEWMHEFGLQKFDEGKSLIPEEKHLFEKWENLVTKEVLYKQEFGITLSEAAKKLQVPARLLSSAINKIYGASFSQYLNDKRVQEARHLIQTHSTMPLLEVMYESGFSTKSHFNKEFRRVLGTSPSQFRMQLVD
jgi:AraC-like DNA-binding protein